VLVKSVRILCPEALLSSVVSLLIIYRSGVSRKKSHPNYEENIK
jgi:hypothetical protein